jgi:Ca2+/Na+ antiporter
MSASPSSPRRRGGSGQPWTVSSQGGIVTRFAGLLGAIFSAMSVFTLIVVGVVEGESIGVVFGPIYLAVAVVAGTIAIVGYRGTKSRVRDRRA